MLERVPYDSKEVNNDLTYPPAREGAPPTRRFDTPVTPRENVYAFYDKNDMPLWMPLGADRRLFAPRLDADNIARAAVYDATPLTPEEIDSLAKDGHVDKHGILWKYIPQATGSIVVPGNPTLLDANDWEKVVQFPDVDSWDWDTSIEENKSIVEPETRALNSWIQTGLFERLIALMDFEGAAMAMIDDDQKDAVLALYDRLADMYIDMARHYKRAYNITIFTLHDDWGSQRAPFFSLDTVMEMIVPSLSRITQAVKDLGMVFDMHSCGKNEMLVPAYIAAGVQSWSPQPMNDTFMLFEQYGDKLIFPLSPDIPITAQTSEEDAVAAAKRFVAKYGPLMETKRFNASGGFLPIYTQTLYEESRKMFS
ncbi:MAG: methyltransferase [Oscillospiraceae bacterium]|nr:methyltransferase [Oscillospiraceae bacterium]